MHPGRVPEQNARPARGVRRNARCVLTLIRDCAYIAQDVPSKPGSTFASFLKRFVLIALVAAATGSLPGFTALPFDAASQADARLDYASGFKALRFDVLLDEGIPVVEWAAESEDGLEHYEVEVSAESGAGARVVEIAPRGAQHPYVYRDDDLYKGAEAVRYTLYAVLEDGGRQIVGSRQIAYTPTAVRRTWGSIKAMFQ